MLVFRALAIAGSSALALVFFLIAPVAAGTPDEPRWKASELLGMQVRDPNTGATGRIKELVVDIANNRVHYAVLDMQNRVLAVPMKLLELDAGEKRAVLLGSGDPPVEPAAGMALARASALIGWEFENEQGVALGAIADLAVDPARGEVPYALVRLHERPGQMHRLPTDAFAIWHLRENLVLTEPLPAAAGPTAPAGDPRLFDRLDRNRDGYLDGVELDRPSAQAKNWRAIDLDGDGRISRAEFAGMRAR